MQHDAEILIAEAVEIGRQRRVLDLQLKSLEWRIEEHFPRQQTHEELTAAGGRAVRVVLNEWWIKPGHLAAVRTILGTSHAHLIDEENPLQPTPGLRALILHPYSEMGRLLLLHVGVNQQVLINFHEPNSGLVVTPGADSVFIDLTAIGAEHEDHS
jgi:hypothetical protein